MSAGPVVTNAPVVGDAPPVIRIRGLSKAYRRGEQLIPVLEGIDLDVNEAEFIALMGPSGSGKSTLLNLIAGIDQPSGGTIEIGGVNTAELREGELADWRAAVAQLPELVEIPPHAPFRAARMVTGAGIDTEEAAAEPLVIGVVDEDGDDGDGAQTVEPR